MRQDPDIIMCGEIRDRATVEMIVQAAITGHLVMSTLHTNDAICVIPRLLDIGLERFLVASSLIGAIAQRLVRKICPDCKEEYTASSAEVAWLHHAGVEEVPAKLWRGTGCEACKNTGHRGRVCAFEILTIDEQLQRMLAEGTDLREIKRTAAGKMRPMRYDAAQKVLAGETTAAEAMRVLAFTPEYR